LLCEDNAVFFLSKASANLAVILIKILNILRNVYFIRIYKERTCASWKADRLYWKI